MPSLVVVGAQWGDEGKGKLVDCLTARADWAVRFQGGNNAGHTLVVNGVKTKLQLTPCGILRPQARCLIGAGVVANPQVLLKEMDTLRQLGVTVDPYRLVIDRDAHIIMDYHPAVDAAREELLGKNKIGTTGRGIGPVYEDRAARRGVRFADLLKLDELKDTLKVMVDEKNRYLSEVLKSSTQVNFDSMWSQLKGYAEILTPHIGNGGLLIYQALKKGEKVVFEGAQATMLDVTHGTVPYVTSCHTVAGAVSAGCGIGPKSIDYVLGVAKAYCTRVGGGPFPSELNDALGDKIRERGAEFGTVTGRPRRCGWFDAVAMRRAVRLNGCDSVAIMKLDVLTGLEKLKIATEYRLNGEVLEDVPALASDLEKTEVEYIEMDGWSEDIGSARTVNDLPLQARRYLDRLSDLIECPVSVVSVGAERDAAIWLNGHSSVKQYL